MRVQADAALAPPASLSCVLLTRAAHLCMPTRPGHFTVNIGDGLTRWTDGLLKSTYHRVRAPREGDATVPDLASPSCISASSIVCSCCSTAC